MLKVVPSPSRSITIIAAVILICLGGQLLYSRPELPHLGIFHAESPPEPNAPPAHDAGSPPWKENSHDSAKPVTATTPDDSKHDVNPLPCQQLPGAEDVVVIMRTGATEIEDKLPVHFDTTFRCYKHLLIFSDYEETFHNYKIHDVLANVDPAWKAKIPDFEIYLRLQRFGRDGLRPEELSGTASFEGSKGGKGNNPGWKLDKWKFLPMMGETLRLRPDYKWYVFVEPDSYVVWSNLLQFLKTRDHAKPLYYGSENQIGPDIFAHGGSVFVLSKPALERAAVAYAGRVEQLHEYTDWHWAGDCILGKTLREEGVPLQWGWPMFQGGQPDKMNFAEKKGEDKKLWCAPALSYHHFSPIETKRMWRFEQAWIQARQKLASQERRWSLWKDYSDILEHRHVFKEFVLPNITSGGNDGLDEWNNLSPTFLLESEQITFEQCRRQCELNDKCLQFSLREGEGCKMSLREVMLGQRWKGYRSGWMMERVEAWMSDLDHCKGHEGWTVI